MKPTMIRNLMAAALGLLLAACASPDSLDTKSVHLVENAKDTMDRMKKRTDLRFFNDLLKDAHAVAVFPTVFKGGFFVGAEGGNGLVVARDSGGDWGYPAFYTLAAGSFGLQIGGQAVEVVLIIRSRKALEAIIRHQGKLGADIGASVGTVGAGYEGATTTNLKLDVVAYSGGGTGVFAGASLEGTALVRRLDYNRAFYGADATPQEILIQQKFQNPVADPLRRSLRLP